MAGSFQLLWPIPFLVLFFISMAGHGKILSRWLFPKSAFGIAFDCATGICSFVALSGYLELFHLGSRTVLCDLVVLGWIFQAFFWVRNAKISFSWDHFRETYAVSLPWIILGGSAFLVYLVNFLDWAFNYHDDYQSYFVFAQKILANGSMGSDPFNVRGIEIGFGAGSYLNALFLTFIPLKSIKIAEAGTGALLLFLMALEQVRGRGGSSTGLVALLMVASILCYAPMPNISPLLLGCAITYSLLVLSFGRITDDLPLGFNVLMGIFLAALIELKGNFIGPAFAVAFAHYPSRLFLRRRMSVLTEGLVAFLVLAVLVGPWLVVNASYAGTALYPIFGPGIVHSGSFGRVGMDVFRSQAGTLVPFGTFFLTLILLYFWSARREGWNWIYFPLLMTAIAFVCLAQSGTYAGGVRYAFVDLMPPIAFLLTEIFTKDPWKSVGTSTPRKSVLLVLFLILISLPQTRFINRRLHDAGGGFGTGLFKRVWGSQDIWRMEELRRTDPGSPSFQSQVIAIQRLQAVVPPVEKLLARLDTPFLLDFSRNPISVMDWPGSSGPGPGVPFEGTSEELAEYLRAQGIHYVAYSYGDEALHSREAFGSRLTDGNPWIRNLAVRTFKVQDQLADLPHHYRLLYDDGHAFVVDLSLPRGR